MHERHEPLRENVRREHLELRERKKRLVGGQSLRRHEHAVRAADGVGRDRTDRRRIERSCRIAPCGERLDETRGRRIVARPRAVAHVVAVAHPRNRHARRPVLRRCGIDDQLALRILRPAPQELEARDAHVDVHADLDAVLVRLRAGLPDALLGRQVREVRLAPERLRHEVDARLLAEEAVHVQRLGERRRVRVVTRREREEGVERHDGRRQPRQGLPLVLAPEARERIVCRRTHGGPNGNGNTGRTSCLEVFFFGPSFESVGSQSRTVLKDVAHIAA